MINKPIILFEDNHLLTLVKPSAYLAQADHSGRKDLLNWGKQYLIEKYNKKGQAYLGLVHRLDLPVTGIMVFAKTSKAAARLCQQFRKRLVKKIYWAIVKKNEFELPTEKKLKTPLIRDGNITRLANDHEDFTLAELEFKTIKQNKEYALLEINLITGYKHQIRAQLAWNLKTPILGDKLYNSPDYFFENQAIALWAVSLSFTHPTLKEEISFKYYPNKNTEPWNWL